MNTHYAVIVFSGDPCEEHPDPELNGQPPMLEFIAAGPEEHCWKALADYTEKRPLQMWQEAEVVERDISLVESQFNAGQTALRELEGDSDA